MINLRFLSFFVFLWRTTGQSCTPTTCAFTKTLNSNPQVIMPCADFGLITGGSAVSIWNLSPPTICTNRYCGPNDGVYTQTISPSNCSAGWYGQITSGTCSFRMNCWYDGNFATMRGTNLKSFGGSASLSTAVASGTGFRGFCKDFPTQSSVYSGAFYAGFGTTNGNSANPTTANIVGSCTICSAGNYCPVNTVSLTTANTCPAGYFCTGGNTDFGGSLPPRACVAGQACASGSSTPSICGPGTYSENNASSSCTRCSAGTGHLLTGQTSSTSCQSCPAGYYCDGTGAPIACPIGTASNETGQTSSGTCTPCSIGSFGDTPATRVCNLCPSGTYGSTIGLSSRACTGPCTAGYFCPLGSTLSTNQSCSTTGSFYCPAGTPQPLACLDPLNMTGPLAVPITNRYQCINCGTNRLCDQGIMLPPIDFGTSCPGGTINLNINSGTNNTDIGSPILTRSNGWAAATMNITLIPLSSPDTSCIIPSLTYNSINGKLTIGNTPFPYCFSGYVGTIIAIRLNDPGLTLGWNTPSTCRLSIMVTQIPVAPLINCTNIIVPEFTSAGTMLDNAITSVNRNVGTFLFHRLNSAVAFPNAGVANPLLLDGCTGRLSTALNLQRTYATSYNLSIAVDNLGLSPIMTSICNITVQIRRVNVAPTLTVKSFSVVDFAPVGTFIGNVMAMDLNMDTVFGYTFVPSVPIVGNPFVIDNQGNLSIANTGILDAYIKTVYTLTVNFTDSSLWTADTITISLIPAPRPPTCYDVTINLIDTAVPGTFLSPSLPISHPQKVPFSIVLGNSNNTFNVSINGTLAVTDTAIINYNLQSFYRFPYTVTDTNGLRATCTATVNLIETNKPPQFSGSILNFTVTEGSLSLSTVANVNASDANKWQVLRYAIASCTPSLSLNASVCPFVIDTLTGTVVVAQLTMGSLKYDDTLSYSSGPQTFSLNISAVDNGSPAITSTVRVFIQIIQIVPRVNFTNGAILPRTGVTAGYTVADLRLITWLPSTYNRSGLVYQVDRQSVTTTAEGAVAFNVTSDGFVIVATPLPTWNYATRNTFPLTILVVDMLTGRETTGNFIVRLAHMNQPPSWMTYPTFLVPARFNGMIGPSLTSYITDNDIGFPGITETLTFTIVSGNTDNTFMVTSGGQVMTANPDTPSFVYTPSPFTIYNLSIKVCDAGIDGPSYCVNGYALLQVSRGNFPPIMASSLFTLAVPENTPFGTVLIDGTNPFASDPDSGQILTYSLSGGTYGPLRVNASTGFIYVGAISPVLDYETKNTYTFIVTATDNFVPSLSTSANVTVTVDDTNEPAVWNSTGIFSLLTNNFVSSFTIPENTTVGTKLARILAIDYDAGSAGQVIYGLQSDAESFPFSIDPSTGILSIVQNLDWEAKPVWNPTVLVLDGSPSPLSVPLVIPVTVVDINDITVTNIRLGSGNGMDNPGLVYGSLFQNLSTVFETSGSVAIIEGTNFGFTMDRIAAQSLSASPSTLVVTYGPTGVEYTATGCSITKANNEITCTVPPGSGTGHIWYVQIITSASGANPNNAVFTTVRTGYLPPTISSVSLSTAVSTNDIPSNIMITDGGASITVSGSNFGPIGTTLRLAYGSSVDASDYIVTCSPSFANPHQIINCFSAPGVGAPLYFKVLIGYQSTGISPIFTGSVVKYAPPTITLVRITPLTALSTIGGENIDIIGTGFGVNGMTNVLALYSNGWIQAGLTSSTPIYTASCVVTVAHRRLTCISVPGVGSSLSLVINVAGQSSTLSLDTIAYHLPQILSISGAGSNRAVSEGGQEIIIQGTQFGPVTLLNSAGTPVAGSIIPIARYGRSLLFPLVTTFTDLKFTAVTCRVSVAHTQISCLTSPGSGANLTWSVSIAGQASIVISNITSNYAPPIVSNYAGPGSFMANTYGKEIVRIQGRNFGPFGTPINEITYGIVGTILQFSATNCSITTEFTEITCLTNVGAGTALTWGLVIDGQQSTTPSTSYGPPTVDSVGILGAAEVHTDGMDTLILTGRYLSRTEYFGSVTYGAGGTTYQATNCSVTIEDVEIRCKTVPGSGRNLAVLVTVGYQTGPLSVTRFSYKPPSIISLTPSSSFTDGGIRVNIFGDNFALNSPSSKLRILVETDTDSALQPSDYDLQDYITKIYTNQPANPTITNWIQTLTEVPSILPSVVSRVSSSVSFIVPEGYGVSRKVLVLVDGVPSNFMNFTYEAPIITNVAADRVDVPTGYLRLFIEGTGFCSGRNKCGTLYINNVVTTPLNWTHTRIFLIIPDNAGVSTTVYVTVGSSISNTKSFTSPVPTISSLTNQGNWGGVSSTVVRAATLNFEVSVQGPVSVSDINTVTVAGSMRTSIARTLGIPSGTVALTTLTDLATLTTTTLSTMDPVNLVTSARRLPSGTGVNFTVQINLATALNALNIRLADANFQLLIANISNALSLSGFLDDLVQVISTKLSLPISSLSSMITPSSLTQDVRLDQIPAGKAMSTRGGDYFYVAGVLSLYSVPEASINVLIGGRPCINLTKVYKEDLGPSLNIPPTSPIATEYYSYDLKCFTPPGIGSNLPIRIQVPGGLSPADPNFVFSYAAPNITSIRSNLVNVEYVGNGGMILKGIPTVGDTLRIQGYNFGEPNLLVSGGLVQIPSSFNLIVTMTDTMSMLRSLTLTPSYHDHELIIIPFPTGQGNNIQLSISIGAQTERGPLGTNDLRPPVYVRYAEPIVSIVYNPSTIQQRDPTVGGTPFSIIGANFGTAGASNSITYGRPIVTVGGFLVNLVSKFTAYADHSKLDCILPEGWGANLPVTVTVAGQQSLSNVTYTYATPIIQSVTPLSGSTSGLDGNGSQLFMTIIGNHFGRGNATIELRPTTLPVADFTAVSIFVDESVITFHNHTTLRFAMPEGAGANLEIYVNIGGQFSLSSGIFFSYTPPKITSIQNEKFSGSYCDPVTYGLQELDGTNVTKFNYPPYPGCFPTLAQQSPNILVLMGESLGASYLPMKISIGDKSCEYISHTHTTAKCKAPSGMGDALPVIVRVGGVQTDPQTIGKPFAYDPPILTSIMPNRPNAAEGETVEFRGHNFGPFEGTNLAISIGGLECRNPIWYNDGLLTCITTPDIVGPKNISILTANRSSSMVWYATEKLIELRCPYQYFGLRGEECVPCGTADDQVNGAKCMGGEMDYDLTVSLLGFWRVNSTTGSQCHPKIAHRANDPRFPGCPVFLACSPVTSCLGANLCAPQYKGERCAVCASQFYRVNDECIKCPDSPWAIVIIFSVGAILALFAAYTLNAKSVNLTLISVGMDWAQVVAMFSRTRVQWPTLVKELFMILSAFNFNLELIAPECAIPEVTYAGKWLFIEGLPLFGWLLLTLLFMARLVWKVAVLCRPRKSLFNHLPVLVATGIVVQRVLYLYVTRTTLDIFNCSPSTPPDYDTSGVMKKYMAYNLNIVCNEPGATHVFLLPFAVAALLIYVVGLPVVSLWWMWKNSAIIHYDQYLRAMISGDDRLTNPYYSFRKTWKALYMNYRPDHWYWEFVVVVRKFLIAFCSLMFRATPSFQLAMSLLVLFIAFVLQVRVNPYLSHVEGDRATLVHRRLVLEGNPFHVRLEEMMRIRSLHNSRNYANSNNLKTNPDARNNISSSSTTSVYAFIAKQRKPFQNALYEGRRVILANRISSTVFDYNTSEYILLASAIIINLAGICFDSSRFTSDNLKQASIRAEYDSLAISTLIVIFMSIIYWFVAMFLDIALVVSPSSVAGCLQRCSGIGRMASTNALALTATKATNRRKGIGANDATADLLATKDSDDTRVIEMVTNPSLISVEGRFNAQEIDVNNVKTMELPPDEYTWKLIRDSFVALSDRARSLNKDNEQLKMQLEMGGNEGGTTSPVVTSPIARVRANFKPVQTMDSNGNTKMMNNNPLAINQSLRKLRTSSSSKPAESP